MSKYTDLSYTFDKYLGLPKGDAYNLYRDEKNIVILKRLAIVIALIFGITSIVHVFDKGVLHPITISYSVVLFSSLVFIFLYKKKIDLSNIRRYLFIFLVTILIIRTSIDIIKSVTITEEDKKENTEKIEKANKDFNITIKDEDAEKDSVASLVFFFCLMIVFFKLSRNEIVQLFTLAFGIPIITELLVYNNFSIWDKVASLIIALVFFIFAYSAETKRKKKFLARLDSYSKRHMETHRMKRELDYAREIQLSMLPPGEAKFGDLEIAGTSVPTYEVGGDYFDYFKISDNLIGIFICDVSGHGVASALLLSGLRSCMHLILEDTNNPKEVFVKLNRMIRKTQSKKMFVTAIFAVIDLEKNTCSLFNAGHLPPYKISGDSSELFKIRRHGITLGAVENIVQDMEETEVVFEFNKNDKLVLYTDGVSEAMDSEKKEYGFERLESFLNSKADKNPSELLDLLLKDVKDFTKETEQKDDMSVMIIGRN
ncbi:MAG: PP2C family protein-serine/threonine phosphatase [Ignavibacteriae bacterium]|nr:PP2C family protein-serine/threonine phosphatase [Ignavibacteriota bacterium]